MTEPDIDWTAVERRARARDPLRALALVVVAAAWGGVSERVFFASGTAKWVVLAAYVATFVGLIGVSRLHPRLRARVDEGYRLQHSLREHVDPGPELREKVDRQAAHLARIVWFRWWLVLFIPVGLLVGAPWGRPLVVVPSALVLIAGVVAGALYLRRFHAAARRWVADPPGPHRAMPAPRRWERWISGWPFVWLLLGLVALCVGAGVLVVVLR